jgi:hypothetical protein
MLVRMRSFRFHIVKEAPSAAESMIVEAHVSGVGKTLFMIDTAYAGAPVLSLSYLARPEAMRNTSVEDRHRQAIEGLRSPVPRSEMMGALTRLQKRGQCRSYTSGCMMRLMGIGETAETHADLLLCPSLKLGLGLTSFLYQSDIFVTHDLPNSTHILTTDYLMHRSPVLISMRHERVYFTSLPNPTMQFLDATLVGGAFSIPVGVSGVQMQCILDTGSGATLSVSKSAAAKLKGRCMHVSEAGGKVEQEGVNGERVCSDLVFADVSVGTHSLRNVHVLLNSHDVQGADAYMGMGIMKAFDWWFSPSRVGVCASGKAVRSQFPHSNGSCE